MADMDLKIASWALAPQILDILKKEWPETKTSYYYLKEFFELREKYEDIRLRYDLLTPGGQVDQHATFVIKGKGSRTTLIIETLNPDLKPLTTLLRNCEGIDWTNRVMFPAIHIRLIPIVYALAEMLHLQFRELPCNSYHIDSESAKALTYKVPEDMYIQQLTEEHAEIADKEWPHGNSAESLVLVKEYIRNRTSVGLFRKGTNKLVAWCLLLPYGGPGVLQVLEDEKRKGYGELVLRAITKECGYLGLDTQAFVIIDNGASNGVFTKVGYQLGSRCSWIHCNRKSTI